MNFFITNREIVKKNRKEVIREDGRERAGDNLRFGTYDIPSETFTLFPEPKKETDTLYSDTDRRLTRRLVGSTRFFKTLYDQLIGEGRQDVLFFIHGFNTDLKTVRKNFKTLDQLYVQNPNSPIQHIVIFTWPGKSPLIPYHYFDDKKDAIRSGEALARSFDKVILFMKKFLIQEEHDACDQKIHLMMHSMAHRVFKHTMLEMKKNNTPIPELFHEILLLAADIEYDIFDQGNGFDSLIDFGDRIHIYYHKKDRVLDISKYTKNFSNRLGRIGRKRVDSSLKNVFDVDVTSSVDDPGAGIMADTFNHWYYYTSTQVVDDLIEVLNGNDTQFPRN